MPKKNNEGGVWKTVGGRRIFIKDGQDLCARFKVLSLNSSDDMIIIDLEEAGYERKE